MGDCGEDWQAEGCARKECFENNFDARGRGPAPQNKFADFSVENDEIDDEDLEELTDEYEEDVGEEMDEEL